MNNNKFLDTDIQKQLVFENTEWSVILPRGPFSPFHLMIVIKNQSITTFDELSSEQLVLLGTCINFIVSHIKQEYTDFIGYNLFSNNGSEKVGQHINQFHQHIFLRFESEPESPYVAMANNRKWSKIDSRDWQAQRKLLAKLLS